MLSSACIHNQIVNNYMHTPAAHTQNSQQTHYYNNKKHIHHTIQSKSCVHLGESPDILFSLANFGFSLDVFTAERATLNKAEGTVEQKNRCSKEERDQGLRLKGKKITSTIVHFGTYVLKLRIMSKAKHTLSSNTQSRQRRQSRRFSIIEIKATTHNTF